TEIYTRSLHDALPIWVLRRKRCSRCREPGCNAAAAIIGTGCRNKGTSAQKGFGGSRPRITSKYSQAAKFVATSAAPKAMSSQNRSEEHTSELQSLAYL